MGGTGGTSMIGGSGGCGTGGCGTGGADGCEGEAGLGGGGGGNVAGLGTGKGTRRRTEGAPLFTGPGSCRWRGRGTGSPRSPSGTRRAGSMGSAKAIRCHRANRGTGLERRAACARTARRGALGTTRAFRACLTPTVVGPRSAGTTGSGALTSTALSRESLVSSARAEIGSGIPAQLNRKKTPMTAPARTPALGAAFSTRRIPPSSVAGAEGQSLA
jgi:hypothetical protein